MAVVCVGCGGDAARKYKCPRCRAAYCSAGCCRAHKEAGGGSECAALAAREATRGAREAGEVAPAGEGGSSRAGAGAAGAGGEGGEGPAAKRARGEAWAGWVGPLPHGMVPEEVPVVGRAALERVARSATVRAGLRDERVAEAVREVDARSRRPAGKAGKVGAQWHAHAQMSPGEALDLAIRGVPGFEALVDAILDAVGDDRAPRRPPAGDPGAVRPVHR